MFKTLLRLFKRDSNSKTSQFDPVNGLSIRAVNDWLQHNPELKKVYEATLQARLRRRGIADSASLTRTQTSRVPNRDVSEPPRGTSAAAALNEEESQSTNEFIDSRRYALPKRTQPSRAVHFGAETAQQMCVL